MITTRDVRAVRVRAIAWLGICAACGAAACRGDDGPPEGPAWVGGSGAIAGSAGAVVAGGGGVAGSGLGGDGGGGTAGATVAGAAGNASAAGSGGAPVEPTPENLFPLAVGNRWTYRVTADTPDSSPCPAGDHSTEITGAAMVDGREAFEVMHVCDALMPGAMRYYAHTELGMETKRCQAGAADCGLGWSVALPRPIVEQAMFEALGGAKVLHRVGSVTVAAGSFDECWETAGVEQGGVVSVLCQDVGPVSFEQVDPELAIDYQLELTSFVVQ